VALDLLIFELFLFALTLVLPQVDLSDFTFHGDTAPVVAKAKLACVLVLSNLTIPVQAPNLGNNPRHDKSIQIHLSALIPSSRSGAQSQNPPMPDIPKDGSKVVYVCACLKTKSCPCMTEAKMEGPCACGTHGGPPLKAVPKDSAWAKENRKALGK